jgi:hypothetical protein
VAQSQYTIADDDSATQKPKYTIEDDDNGSASTTPAPEPTFVEKAAQGKAGMWDAIKHAANPMSIPGDVSEMLGKVGDWAQKKAEEKETQSLGNIAKGGQAPAMSSYTPGAGYDLLARTAHMGSGATNPTNVAIGGGAVVAPEIVGPALIAHGGLGAIKAGEDIAERGLNPENAESGLTSLSEAAGGGASLGEIPARGGLKNTLTGKAASGALKATGGAGLGLGLPAEDLITKGVRPRARAQGWQDAMQSPGVQRAIKEADAATPIKTIEDFHDAIGPMKDKLWNEQVQPALDRQGPRPVDMKPAAQRVRDAITPTMREFNPQGVTALEDLAGKLEKSRTVAEANELQKYANGQVETYHAKYPTARRAAMNSDPDVLGWETARQGIREQLNKTLEDAGETQTADARKDYGHLTGIEKELERKVNPNERKAPINLARTLGLIGAWPTHGLSIPAGELISHMNDPNVLLRRGIAKLNPPEAAPFTPPPAFKPPAAPASQIPLNLPPENAPLFNIQQTPKLRPDFEEPRLGAIHGEQQSLGLAPPEAPLFNIQTPNPRGGLGRIGETPGALVPPESSASSASPIRPPGPRWTGDRGAMPGEPMLYLDGDSPETAKAAIVEEQDPRAPGRSTFDAYLPNGELLGRFGTAEEAARHAESIIPKEGEDLGTIGGPDREGALGTIGGINQPRRGSSSISLSERGRPSAVVAGSPPGTQAPLRQVSGAAVPSEATTRRTTSPSESTQGPAKTEPTFISPSTKSVLHDANNVNDLRALAKKKAPELQKTLDSITEEVPGIKATVRPEKALDRLQEKIKAKNREPNQISDYLAGQVVVDNLDQYRKVVDRLRAKHNVVEDDNFLATGKDTKGGYRAHNLQIDMGDGLTAEVQVVPRDVHEVTGQTHALYEQMRKPGTPATEVEAARKKATNLNEEAWEKFESRQK